MNAAFLAAFCIVGSATAATDPYPQVARAYLLRADTQVLYAKAPHARLPPASLTKIMLALVVLEQYVPEAIATISKTAANETGTRLGLRAGDRIRVDDLLRAALIASANDACRALAEWNAGTQSRFVDKMNRTARQMNLRNTHFTNACGHDDVQHYASAHDLATLTDRAMQDSRFATIVRVVETKVSTVDGARAFNLKNRNALIGRYPGAIGVKSGYTPRAGRCIVAWAERDGHRVLAVLLHARERWWDTHALMNAVFEDAAQLAK